MVIFNVGPLHSRNSNLPHNSKRSNFGSKSLFMSLSKLVLLVKVGVIWTNDLEAGVYSSPSPEIQGQLVGSIKCPWWKFTVRSKRAGSFRCYSKPFTMDILSTRLTAPGSPRMTLHLMSRLLSDADVVWEQDSKKVCDVISGIDSCFYLARIRVTWLVKDFFFFFFSIPAHKRRNIDAKIVGDSCYKYKVLA